MEILKSKFILALLALLFAFIGATIFWFVGADRLEQNVLAQHPDRSGAGVTIACGDTKISGYPFRYVITCEDVRIGVRLDGLAPFDIQLERLQRVALVYRSNQYLFFAKGPLRILDARSGERDVLSAQFSLASLSTRMSDKGLERASLALDNFTMVTGNTPLEVNLKRLEAHFVPADPEADTLLHRDYDLFVSGRGGDVDKPFTLRARGDDVIEDRANWSDRQFLAQRLTKGLQIDTRLFVDAAAQIDFEAPDYKGNVTLSDQAIVGQIDRLIPELAQGFLTFDGQEAVLDGTTIDLSGLFGAVPNQP